MLKHLAEQTGLTYTREKRPIRILFVERPKQTIRMSSDPAECSPDVGRNPRSSIVT